MCRKENKFVWRYLNIYRIKLSNKMKLVKKQVNQKQKLKIGVNYLDLIHIQKEYKEIKGRLVDAVAPLNADKIKRLPIELSIKCY